MELSFVRSQADRSGRTDFASIEKKDFKKKPSLGGGFFVVLGLLFLATPAGAQDAPAAGPPVDEERARLMRMLQEMELPPAVSYHQAPPPTRAALVLRQHDVEEKSRES